MREGESILTYFAAGGTGQAAIQVANNFSVEVFVNVDSIEN